MNSILTKNGNELDRIEINQKGGKSLAHGTRAWVNLAGSWLTRMLSQVGTGSMVGHAD
jgi:hypothetical protein